jgi:hypothetical protein
MLPFTRPRLGEECFTTRGSRITTAQTGKLIQLVHNINNQHHSTFDCHIGVLTACMLYNQRAYCKTIIILGVQAKPRMARICDSIRRLLGMPMDGQGQLSITFTVSASESDYHTFPLYTTYYFLFVLSWMGALDDRMRFDGMKKVVYLETWDGRGWRVQLQMIHI